VGAWTFALQQVLHFSKPCLRWAFNSVRGRGLLLACAPM